MNLPRNITELQEGLINKKFSAVELVDNYLARIKAFDKELNSFITVTEERAYTDAKKIDTKIQRYDDIKDREKLLEEFPLLGVVGALKDLFLTEGIRSTAGAKVLSDYVPAYSSTVVKRLEKAGMILIGKTNQDAWAHGASGENSDFGATKNPWNTDYVPGGSSSGSAVSVAAGFSMFSMGTDTGGSIRLPACFTNTVGFKPTYGAVSRYGVVAMASSLDSVGHFTRTVDDAKKIFEITKGEDGHDATLRNPKFENLNSKQIRNTNVQNSELRIGIPKEYFGDGIDVEVKNKVMEAVEVYRKMGLDFKEVNLPHTKYGVAVYYIIQPAEVSSNLARYDGVRFGNKRDSFADEAKRRIMLGAYVLSAGYYDAYYLRAMKVRSKIINDFEEVFNEVDALIAPVSATGPFKLGERASDPLQMYLSDILTANVNLAGLPGISIPAGFLKNGMPTGFQLIGPRFSENLLFDLGIKYQEKTDHHLNLPSL